MISSFTRSGWPRLISTGCGDSRGPASFNPGFVLMKTLLEAADIQLRMEATGGALVEIPAAICEKTAHQYEHHDSGRGSADWPAYLRMLDTVDRSYRD